MKVGGKGQQQRCQGDEMKTDKPSGEAFSRLAGSRYAAGGRSFSRTSLVEGLGISLKRLKVA